MENIQTCNNDKRGIGDISALRNHSSLIERKGLRPGKAQISQLSYRDQIDY